MNLGQLKEKKLHNDLQSTAFAYNERGWMTGSSSNEFSMELRYNENITGEADAQFNGNIANQLWGQGNSLPYSFGYRYDKLNRLKKGIAAGLTDPVSEQMEYDVMAAMQTIMLPAREPVVVCGLCNQWLCL